MKSPVTEAAAHVPAAATSRVSRRAIHVCRRGADLSGMDAGPDFAHVLEQQLARARDEAARRGARALPPTFWRSDPGLTFQAAVDGSLGEWGSSTGARAYASAAAAMPGASPSHPPGLPRVLRARTAAQREAVDTIERLGGPCLGVVFFEDELKRAFRTLARRWHPDAHPSALPDERRHLAASFAALTSACRTLLSPA